MFNSGQAVLACMLDDFKSHSRLDDPPFQHVMPLCASAQLIAMYHLLADMHMHQQAAAAAMAATVARPQALLPWLSTVTDVLQTCGAREPGSRNSASINWLFVGLHLHWVSPLIFCMVRWALRPAAIDNCCHLMATILLSSCCR